MLFPTSLKRKITKVRSGRARELCAISTSRLVLEDKQTSTGSLDDSLRAIPWMTQSGKQKEEKIVKRTVIYERHSQWTGLSQDCASSAPLATDSVGLKLLQLP